VRVFLGVVILAAAATMQTACAGAAARLRVGVDLPLVAVLSLAMLVGEGGALAAAVFAGLCKDAFTAGAFGHSVAVLIPLAILVVRLRALLWTGHWAVQAAIAFCGTLAAAALYALLAALGGEPAGIGPGPLLAGAVVNAFAAPPCFRIWRAVLR
jgi:rod shape-determining protein MreD